jgi:hypothetical protein
MLSDREERQFAEFAAQAGDAGPDRMCVARCKVGVLLAASAAFVGWMLAIAPLPGAMPLVAVLAGAVVVGRSTIEKGGCG